MIGNEPPAEAGGVPVRRRPSNLSGAVGQGKVSEGARPQFQRPAPAAPEAVAPTGPEVIGSWWRRRWMLVAAAALVAGAIAVPFWLAVQKAPTTRPSPAGVPLSGGGGGPVAPLAPGPSSAAPRPSRSASPAPAAPVASPSPSSRAASSRTPAPRTTSAKPKGQVTAKPGGGADLALNRPVTRSGAEAPHFEATMAVDGDDTSRWGSAWESDGWIAVDLGRVWAVRSVEVLWEHAHPATYRIEVSRDGRTWKTARSGIPGREGLITTSLDPTPARWVRLSTKRKPDSQYGVSLWSLRVR